MYNKLEIAVKNKHSPQEIYTILRDLAAKDRNKVDINDNDILDPKCMYIFFRVDLDEELKLSFNKDKEFQARNELEDIEKTIQKHNITLQSTLRKIINERDDSHKKQVMSRRVEE